MAPPSSVRALEALRVAGLGLTEWRDAAPPWMEGVRMALKLRQRGLRTVGLAPADDDVAVPPVAMLVGSALAKVSGRPVGLVDATGTWPGAPELRASSPPDESLLVTSWLGDGLAILGPRTYERGAALASLRAAVALVPAAFDLLLVDLTGLDHLGDLPAATKLLDGVLLVARTGRTTGRQVRRWLREAGDGRGLGVLLTGT